MNEDGLFGTSKKSCFILKKKLKTIKNLNNSSPNRSLFQRCRITNPKTPEITQSTAILPRPLGVPTEKNPLFCYNFWSKRDLNLKCYDFSDIYCHWIFTKKKFELQGLVTKFVIVKNSKKIVKHLLSSFLLCHKNLYFKCF